jgi:hypothetical protein
LNKIKEMSDEESSMQVDSSTEEQADESSNIQEFSDKQIRQAYKTIREDMMGLLLCSF